MRTLKLSLHCTGSCRHPEISTRRDGRLSACAFPMFAAVLDRGGELVVFDPGYAPRMLEATERFPEKLYRLATPMEIEPERALAARLGPDAERVSTVIVSHFHADHVAGLIDFPKARIVASRAAFEHFSARSGLAAVTRGYLKALAPADLARRLIFLDDLPATPLGPEFAPFADGRDLFGDSSLLLMQLPGHAAGQIGAAFTGADGEPRLLIADAAWSLPALHADAPPPWPTLAFLGEGAAYRNTWAQLRNLVTERPLTRLIPSHCPVAAAREGASLV